MNAVWYISTKRGQKDIFLILYSSIMLWQAIFPEIYIIYLCISHVCMTEKIWFFSPEQSTALKRNLIYFNIQPTPVLNFRYCCCLHMCVYDVCVCMCVNHDFVRTITHHIFKLGSPNLDNRCKTPWLRSLLCCISAFIIALACDEIIHAIIVMAKLRTVYGIFLLIMKMINIIWW